MLSSLSVSIHAINGQVLHRRLSLPRSAAALASLLAASCCFGQSDFTRVVVPSVQTVAEKTATAMLVEETERRTSSGVMPKIETGPFAAIGAGEDVVVLAERPRVAELLPAGLVSAWRTALSPRHQELHAESYIVVTLPWHTGHVTVIAGDDERGELFGAGWLLRNLRFRAAPQPQIPLGIALDEIPEKSVRGQQIGYRAKNNTYDAWTLSQFEQHIRELAIFGNNTIQLISPISDDARNSPLFHVPAFETVIGISAIVAKYGLDCDLYYPEMGEDYRKPETVDAELKQFETLVRAMPRIDSLHVPGGDPGHTAPQFLFPLVAKQVEILHRYHPRAKVWISAQGFDAERFATFYKLLAERPAWLTGIFFGPQSRDSFPFEREHIPAQYEMQFYPDIAHTMHAEFPIPQWDPVFAVTEGREPICPRPEAFATIYRHYAGLNTGFITYSEGVNDHVNQILFDRLGWSSKTPVDTILAEYARFFLRREGRQQTLAVQAIHGLEENWTGPIPVNPQIAKTLATLKQLQDGSTKLQTEGNGEWESLLYRAAYDRFLQIKAKRERLEEAKALDALGAGDADAARQALGSLPASAEEKQLHDRLFALAAELFHDWGIQLSVPLYGASNWERGSNLDKVDTPLNDGAWIEYKIAEALAKPDAASRTEALQAIANWEHPVPGAIYDDLGDPAHEPHLMRGEGWLKDPQLYKTAIDSIADRTLNPDPSPDPFAKPEPKHPEMPWRFSWLTYAETLYETPLHLRYAGLDRKASWKVRITYAGEDYALPLSLTANGNIEIHPAHLRKSNPETVEFAIPPTATANGTLTLSWVGPSGSPGSGRGRQVAEVWLIPTANPVH
jgi:hypothetical protein